jgi:hypothetical protein
MSTQPPNLVNSSTPSGQSPLLNGINAAGGWGKALSGLVQLPGAMWNSFQAGNQAANAKNAATGQPYQIPGGIGIAQNAKALTATNANKPTATSGIIPVANTQTNPPASGAGVSDIPNNNGTLQDELASKQSQLASLQAQQAALDKSNAAGTGTTDTSGTTGTGTTGTDGTPTLSSTATALSNTASSSSPQYQADQDLYNKGAAQVTAAQKGLYGGELGTAGMPIPQGFKTGREAAIQGQQGALENIGLAQENAANTNQQTATNQQSTQQSGLYQAGGLVSPTVGSYGQTQYLPTGGTVGGGSGSSVSPSDPFYATMQTYAEALANNQGTAIPSSITGNPALQAQLLQMAKQINPNFNYNQATATGQSQQAQTGQAQQYQSAAQQASNLGLQLNQVINSTGVNPSDINAANSAIQKIASNTSNPNYATFQNLITDLANTYAQVLTPAGGSTTDMVRTISGSLLDSSMKGSGISQVMQNLDAQVQAKIAGVTTAYGTQSNNTTASGANPWH